MKPIRQGTEAELAYCAGIVDGEGCISVYRKKKSKRLPQFTAYCYKLGVRMVDLQAIRLLSELFGGYLRLNIELTTGKLPMNIWVVESRQACECLRQLFPYLRIKRLQAEMLFRLAENVQKYRPVGRTNRLAAEDIELRKNIIQQVHDANQRKHLREQVVN